MGKNVKKSADDKRGSAPGERRGGREAGTPNISATQARSDLLHAELRAQGRRPAVEYLRYYMEEFHTKAQLHKPKWGEPEEDGSMVDANPFGDEPAYHQFAAKAVECATRLAPYENPTYRSINVPAPPPQLPGEGEEQRNRFSLSIFDNQGRPAPRAATLPPPANTNGIEQMPAPKKANGHG